MRGSVSGAGPPSAPGTTGSTVGARKVVRRLHGRGRLHGAGRAARPRGVRRVMDRYFDAMQAAVPVTAGWWRSSSATPSWPCSGSRGSMRTTRCGPFARQRICAPRCRAERRARVRYGSPGGRTGVNTGEVLASDPRRRARHHGRCRQRGGPAGTGGRARPDRAGGDHVRIVRRCGRRRARPRSHSRGSRSPSSVYLLVSADTASIPPWRMDSPLVGREDELALLGSGISRAVDAGPPSASSCLGPAGIGKSRTATEFAAGLGRACPCPPGPVPP